MDDVVRDRTFGEVSYKHAWIKKQDVMLLGKERQIKIMAAAYTGEKICEEQRQGYRYFLEHLSTISEQCRDAIYEYVDSNREDLSVQYPQIKEFTKGNLSEFVTPRTALFARDGSIIILFDAKWDEENGIGVEVYPDVWVGLQDMFI